MGLRNAAEERRQISRFLFIARIRKYDWKYKIRWSIEKTKRFFRKISMKFLVFFGGIRRDMSLIPSKPVDAEMLYPVSRQFPFDGVCDAIIRELEKRNWQVPGINVEFNEYGSGERKFKMVSKITGCDFKLRFCRTQRKIPDTDRNDIAAVTELAIPMKELHVYEDESGPTFYLYTGKSWESDRDLFMNGPKVLSKLYNERKTYLKYKGGCNCRNDYGAAFEAVGFIMAMMAGDESVLREMKHTHQGRRSPILVHDNDLGREYDPEGEEPKTFTTHKVFREFNDYLEKEVLKCITDFPELLEAPVKEEKAIELFPEAIGPLFSFCDSRSAERIKVGRACPKKLRPCDRYGLIGSPRFVTLGVRNDGTVPDIAYDGFTWCGIGEVDHKTRIESLEVPGHYRWSETERHIVRITPKTADGIYIADQWVYEDAREKLWQTIEASKPLRDRLTDEEVNELMRIRGRTLIPIMEYKGDYKKPVVLVNKELSLDEVKIVGKPGKSRF